MSMQPATPPPTQLGRPLGTGRDWRRRLLLHHAPLAIASAVLFVLFMSYTPASPPAQLDMFSGSPFPLEAAAMGHSGSQTSGYTLSFDPESRSFMPKSTTATGYVATGLLALTLLIGPANLLLRRRNPVSTSLARDTGTWATIASVIHVILGFQVHGRGQTADILRYFIADGTPLTNSFGLANWTGLAALVIVVGLLSISTDSALRELKARRWKSLQRLNYALFALVVLHAFFYGALLRTTSPFTLLLIAIVTTILAGQAVGIGLWRRRYPSTRERQPTAATR